jgi:hypothetical protein
LHHIWIGDTIPDPYNRCAEENRQFCLENKIEYRVWGNQDLEDAQACDEGLRTILSSVPAGDWACRKDVFALWILMQRGGVVADCSILVKPEFVNAFDHVEHLLFYPDDSPDIKRLPHAIPCPITFIGAPARSPLIEWIYNGFARFWQSDYLRMNKLYTHPVRFGDRTVPHGWMAQLYINECLMEHLLARSPGKSPDDIFLSHTEFMHDIDFVPAAYVFKYMYLALLPKSEFFRLAAPYKIYSIWNEIRRS